MRPPIGWNKFPTIFWSELTTGVGFKNIFDYIDSMDAFKAKSKCQVKPDSFDLDYQQILHWNQIETEV